MSRTPIKCFYDIKPCTSLVLRDGHTTSVDTPSSLLLFLFLNPQPSIVINELDPSVDEQKLSSL